MNTAQRFLLLLAAAIVAAIAGGCATTSPAERYRAPDFANAVIATSQATVAQPRTRG